jgi:hypothetical protein
MKRQILSFILLLFIIIACAIIYLGYDTTIALFSVIRESVGI